MGSRWRHLPIWETSISERCSESLSKSSGSPYVCSLSFLCAARGVLPPPQAGSRDYEHKENEPLYFFISKILLFPLKETNLPNTCHLQDGQPSRPRPQAGHPCRHLDDGYTPTNLNNILFVTTADNDQGYPRRPSRTPSTSSSSATTSRARGRSSPSSSRSTSSWTLTTRRSALNAKSARMTASNRTTTRMSASRRAIKSSAIW